MRQLAFFLCNTILYHRNLSIRWKITSCRQCEATLNNPTMLLNPRSRPQVQGLEINKVPQMEQFFSKNLNQSCVNKLDECAVIKITDMICPFKTPLTSVSQTTQGHCFDNSRKNNIEWQNSCGALAYPKNGELSSNLLSVFLESNWRSR